MKKLFARLGAGFALACCLPSHTCPAPVLTGVALDAAGASVSLVVPSSSPIHVFALTDPHRLVIDVPALSGLPGAPKLHRWPIARWGIHEVRTSQFRAEAARPVTRFVLQLDQAPAWHLTSTEGGYRVELDATVPQPERLVLGVLTGIVDRAPEPTAGEPAPARPHEPTFQPESAMRQEPVTDHGAAEASAGAPLQRATASAVSAAHPIVDGDTKPKEIPAAAPAHGAKNTRSTDHGAPPASTAAPTEARAAGARTPGEERIWNRRAAELVAEARLHFAAGAYRDGLDRLARVFAYYPATTQSANAHALAARFACELHLGDEALEHVSAVFEDSLAADSVIASCVETLAGCPLVPGSAGAVRAVYDRSRDRLGPDAHATKALGVTLGKVLAESGQDLDVALALLADGIKLFTDAADAAEVHRAVGLCLERKTAFADAAEQQLFASRLLTVTDRHAALALRLRAADNLFRADAIDEAIEQYASIAPAEEAAFELRSWAAFQLGNCYYRKRLFDRASEAYEALRASYPSSFWSQQAQARLAVLKDSPAGTH